MARAVIATPELSRVLSLTRRTWTDDADFAAALTARLRTPHGTMTLRPNQAQALYEIAACGGAVLPMRVGSGKTLISALAAVVVGAERPLLLVPAHLKEKTAREFRELAEHFRIPNYIRIESYQFLGRVAGVTTLDAYGPDLILADEAHYLKNIDVGVTRRVRRYLEGNPRCKFVAMSGTITRTSIKEFAHLLLWALGASRAPLPMSTLRELSDWAAVLDAKDSDTDPGALVVFAEGQDWTTDEELRSAVRRGYQKRLTETWGVVATHDKPEDLGVSLTVRHLRHDPPGDIVEAMRHLRAKWETPDGWPLFDGKDVARHARELAMGFFYKWDPRPPKEWLAARKEWSAMCRRILTHNQRNLDTAKAVVDHIHLYPEALEPYSKWKEIEPTFEPNTVPVWISDYAVNLAKEWLTENDGIVWTEHTAFAHRLEHATGAPYYGQGGLNRAKQPIESHNPKRDGSCIASLKANSTGRNLQAWQRSLVVSPYMNAAMWEQNLGRLHRPGQQADEVLYDIFMLCDEHEAAWEEALSMSRYEQEISGQEQKLLYASVA